ncbi:MAG: 30S ribosomal protein THX [Bacteroidales bacterium]|nr:MAG: 30S ribosomal protein THX [Bacteroidales bacterium]
MGKGDKKTRRGKLFMGSYGNTRPKSGAAKVEKAVVTEAPKQTPKAKAKVKK